MADVARFITDDIQKLFDDKHIVVIGDSGVLNCFILNKLNFNKPSFDYPLNAAAVLLT